MLLIICHIDGTCLVINLIERNTPVAVFYHKELIYQITLLPCESAEFFIGGI